MLRELAPSVVVRELVSSVFGKGASSVLNMLTELAFKFLLHAEGA